MAVDPSPPSQAVPLSPRRQALVTVVLLAVIGALLYALVQVLQNSGRLEAMAGAACRGDVASRAELRRYLGWVLALVPASTVGFATYVGVLGRRSLRLEVFPPPGMITLRPVRSLGGPAARRCGVVMLGFAAVLVVLATLLALIGLRLLATLHR